jgi:phosphoglycolate phosphatase-like HAD superfamily hydrolase
MNDQERLAELLRPVRHVLLDFDGPVCSVFGGKGAASAAERLREAIQNLGLPIPEALAKSADPLGVFQHVARLHPNAAPALASALEVIEVDAIATAMPTPGAIQFLEACAGTGRAVAIVSNNGAPAVRRYLARHRLDGLVATVAARTGADPEQMKPSPFLPRAAMSALGAKSGDSIMVGDSESDIHAATAAHLPALGYANRPDKRERLIRAGAAAVIDDHLPVIDAMGRPLPRSS